MTVARLFGRLGLLLVRVVAFVFLMSAFVSVAVLFLAAVGVVTVK